MSKIVQGIINEHRPWMREREREICEFDISIIYILFWQQLLVLIRDGHKEKKCQFVVVYWLSWTMLNFSACRTSLSFVGFRTFMEGEGIVAGGERDWGTGLHQMPCEISHGFHLWELLWFPGVGGGGMSKRYYWTWLAFNELAFTVESPHSKPVQWSLSFPPHLQMSSEGN